MGTWEKCDLAWTAQAPKSCWRRVSGVCSVMEATVGGAEGRRRKAEWRKHKGQSTLQSLVGLGLNNGTGSNCAGKLLGVLSKGVIY